MRHRAHWIVCSRGVILAVFERRSPDTGPPQEVTVDFPWQGALLWMTYPFPTYKSKAAGLPRRKGGRTNQLIMNKNKTSSDKKIAHEPSVSNVAQTRSTRRDLPRKRGHTNGDADNDTAEVGTKKTSNRGLTRSAYRVIDRLKNVPFNKLTDKEKDSLAWADKLLAASTTIPRKTSHSSRDPPRKRNYSPRRQYSSRGPETSSRDAVRRPRRSSRDRSMERRRSPRVRQPRYSSRDASELDVNNGQVDESEYTAKQQFDAQRLLSKLSHIPYDELTEAEKDSLAWAEKVDFDCRQPKVEEDIENEKETAQRVFSRLSAIPFNKRTRKNKDSLAWAEKILFPEYHKAEEIPTDKHFNEPDLPSLIQMAFPGLARNNNESMCGPAYNSDDMNTFDRNEEYNAGPNFPQNDQGTRSFSRSDVRAAQFVLKKMPDIPYEQLTRMQKESVDWARRVISSDENESANTGPNWPRNQNNSASRRNEDYDQRSSEMASTNNAYRMDQSQYNNNAPMARRPETWATPNATFGLDTLNAESNGIEMPVPPPPQISGDYQRSYKRGHSPRTEVSKRSSYPSRDLPNESFTWAVVDRNSHDGSISPSDWKKVEAALLKVYLDVLAKHPGPPPSCHDAGWYQDRFKLISCADKRSAELYREAIASVGSVWPGASLAAVPQSEISGRPRAQVHLPLQPSHANEILDIIKYSNPELPTYNWEVCNVENDNGRSLLAIILLNDESLEALDATNGRITYGFTTVKLTLDPDSVTSTRH